MYIKVVRMCVAVYPCVCVCACARELSETNIHAKAK